jgi:hypothetical protein
MKPQRLEGSKTQGISESLSLRVLVFKRMTALAFLLLGFSGCGTKSIPAQENGVLDLRDRLSVLSREAGGSYSPHFAASRNGIDRDSILLIPPITVRASLKGIAGHATLVGIATPVYNIGDGMQLDVVLIQEGNRRTVYTRYYDPGRKTEDRKWIPFKIPLDLPQGNDIRIELRVSAGMQGDLVADWLAVSELRVIAKT